MKPRAGFIEPMLMLQENKQRTWYSAVRGTRRTCAVLFQDSDGVRYAVEVGAETLYEAAVLALKSFPRRRLRAGAGSTSGWIEVKRAQASRIRSWREISRNGSQAAREKSP